jgi:hypothetical protein
MSATARFSWGLAVASFTLLPRTVVVAATDDTHLVVQSITVTTQAILASSGEFLQSSVPVFHSELNRFSPSMGTLVDVELKIDSRWTLFGTPGVLPGSVHGEVIGGVAWDGIILRILDGQGTFPVFSQEPFARLFELDEDFSLPTTAFIGEGQAKLEFPVAVFGNSYFLSPTNTGAILGLDHFTMELTYRYTAVPEPATLVLLTFVAAGIRLRRRYCA